ncbi:hypothetical protein ACP1ES_004916, partial [Escherichia coli]
PVSGSYYTRAAKINKINSQNVNFILRMRKITQSAGRTREGHAIQQTGRSPVFIALAIKKGQVAL